MLLLKKNLYLAIASLLLLGNNVSKVMADDCAYVESAINYLGDDFKKLYTAKNCCEFKGVVCNSNKQVTEIKFNSVNGKQSDFAKVSEKLSKLTSLTSLDLSGNNISGSFPKSLCSLKNLKSLNLSGNQLNGTIPFQCKDLANIENLNLDGNTNLTGYVPILPKMKACIFKKSGLCDLPTTSCRGASKPCTLDDVKKTNANNGNPDPKSETYEGAPKDRAMNVYDDGYGYGSGSYGYGYDNSYGYGYDNGYGYGYDNSGYGYGYDNSGYGYGNGYSNGYSGNSYGYNDDLTTPFNSLGSVIIYLIFFGVIILTCCSCCCARGNSQQPSKPQNNYSAYANSSNANSSTTSPSKPTGPKPTTIDVDPTNPYNQLAAAHVASQDITNANTNVGSSTYSGNPYNYNSAANNNFNNNFNNNVNNGGSTTYSGNPYAYDAVVHGGNAVNNSLYPSAPSAPSNYGYGYGREADDAKPKAEAKSEETEAKK